jgi:hypothetical protein
MVLPRISGGLASYVRKRVMKMPKFTILETAVISGAAILFQNLILFASFLKFNDIVWNIYKYHGEAYDLILSGAYILMFVVSWAVWFCADMPLSKRFLFAGVLFAVLFFVSLVLAVVVCFIYGVAVGGY